MSNLKVPRMTVNTLEAFISLARVRFTRTCTKVLEEYKAGATTLKDSQVAVIKAVEDLYRTEEPPTAVINALEANDADECNMPMSAELYDRYKALLDEVVPTEADIPDASGVALEVSVKVLNDLRKEALDAMNGAREMTREEVDRSAQQAASAEKQLLN